MNPGVLNLGAAVANVLAFIFILAVFIKSDSAAWGTNTVLLGLAVANILLAALNVTLWANARDRGHGGA